MSRIGKLPVKIEEGVNIDHTGNVLKASGPLGELSLEIPRQIKLEITDGIIKVARNSDDKKVRALHGLYRVLINNIIVGVSKGWEKKLDYKGVGFKAEVQENKLVLHMGFSHLVELTAPEGITFNVTKNVITVSGIDKQVVGQMAANIRKVKPVEPYKGKGIKYIDEIPRKKLGKAAKTATTA